MTPLRLHGSVVFVKCGSKHDGTHTTYNIGTYMMLGLKYSVLAVVSWLGCVTSGAWQICKVELLKILIN